MLKRGQVWISACDHRVNGAAGYVSKEEEECLPLYPASDTLRARDGHWRSAAQWSGEESTDFKVRGFSCGVTLTAVPEDGGVEWLHSALLLSATAHAADDSSGRGGTRACVWAMVCMK